jgi:hypothetical protein
MGAVAMRWGASQPGLLGSAAAAASSSGSPLWRHGSRHVRNSSDGALPLVNSMGVISATTTTTTTTTAAASAAAAAALLLPASPVIESGSCLNASAEDSGDAAPPQHGSDVAEPSTQGHGTGVTGGTSCGVIGVTGGDRFYAPDMIGTRAARLAVTAEPALQLSVYNASGRYFRCRRCRCWFSL